MGLKNKFLEYNVVCNRKTNRPSKKGQLRKLDVVVSRHNRLGCIENCSAVLKYCSLGCTAVFQKLYFSLV